MTEGHDSRMMIVKRDEADDWFHRYDAEHAVSKVPSSDEDTLAALWREHDVADAIDREDALPPSPRWTWPSAG